MDWFEIFHFSTALPFGYVLFFGAMLAVIIAGGFAAFNRKAPSPMRWLGGAAGLGAVIFVAGNVIAHQSVDFHPAFTDAELVGHWVDGDSTLDLAADGSARFHLGRNYEKRVPQATGLGIWRRGGGDVTITAVAHSDASSLWWVVRSAGAPRLVLEDWDDPDEWDGHLGFRRAS